MAKVEELNIQIVTVVVEAYLEMEYRQQPVEVILFLMEEMVDHSQQLIRIMEVLVGLVVVAAAAEEEEEEEEVIVAVELVERVEWVLGGVPAVAAVPSHPPQPTTVQPTPPTVPSPSPPTSQCHPQPSQRQ